MTNNWISQVSRTYEQLVADGKQAVIDNVPEMTDHSENNDLILALNVWAAIAEGMNYNLDVKARESFISTMRKLKTAYLHSEANDYRVKGAYPASGEVLFTINTAAGTDILIPKGTEVKSKSGISFYTSEDVTIITGNTSVVASISNLNIQVSTSIGTGTGAKQSIVLPDKVADGTIGIAAMGFDWEPVETFSYSSPQDYHFIAGINKNGLMQVNFGDGINGRVVGSGQDIQAVYGFTDGLDSNVGTNTITEIISSITVPIGILLSVNNTEETTGGSNSEGLEAIRNAIPKKNRTRYKATTKQDYIDVAELAPGVSKSGCDYECGRTVDVYIIPDGGGLASPLLIQKTQDWMDDNRHDIITKVRVKQAGNVRVVLGIDLNILPGYSRTAIKQLVSDALVAFGSEENQLINGSVEIGDIYEKIEGVKGVANGRVRVMNTIPYAFPYSNEPQLFWSIETKSGSTSIVKWKIIITNSGANFILFKDGTQIGTYSTLALVTLDEIEFTINTAGYTTGNTWSFTSYPYMDSLDLDEQSIAVINESDITYMTVNGGF